MESAEDGVRLLSVAPSARRRGNGQKLEWKRLCLNIRKHVFTVHGDGAWAQVAHKESPSLKIFKTHLDMVLGNLL